jgi:hypothetical protein
MVMKPVSSWVSDLFDTDIKRKRNSTEVSLTLPSRKPDLVWLVDGTLMFKGEDKTNDADMGIALAELRDKMKDWSSNYHGQARADC